jgi:hypothetical protein
MTLGSSYTPRHDPPAHQEDVFGNKRKIESGSSDDNVFRKKQKTGEKQAVKVISTTPRAFIQFFVLSPFAMCREHSAAPSTYLFNSKSSVLYSLPGMTSY